MKGSFYLSATIATVLSGCATFGASVTDEQRLLWQKKSHYNGEVFVNRLPTPLDALDQAGGILNMLRRYGDPIQTRPKDPLPVMRRRAQDFDSVPLGGLRITWLGHSTMLIEIDGKRFLTDPIWGAASPFAAIGPDRFVETPLPLSELPVLDAVLISHDHYDHLEMETIQELAKTGVKFYVPLGVDNHLRHWSVPEGQIEVFDWWQEAKIDSFKIVSVPSRHFSGRGISDQGHTLWTSWVIVGPRHRVFFSGDTGMHCEFEEIGEKYGPFDVTMLEVGAYDAWWSDVHLGPEQAVVAHQALRGRLLLPVHWGTYSLAYHSFIEPAERLSRAAVTQGVELRIPRHGQSVLPARLGRRVAWWPDVGWETKEERPVVATHLEECSAKTTRER